MIRPQEAYVQAISIVVYFLLLQNCLKTRTLGIILLELLDVGVLSLNVPVMLIRPAAEAGQGREKRTGESRLTEMSTQSGRWGHLKPFKGFPPIDSDAPEFCPITNCYKVSRL